MEIAAPICTLSLLILYLSGWFPDWAEDFKTTRSNLIFVLLTMSFLSWCRPWVVSKQFFVHPAWVVFLIILCYLGNMLSRHSIFTLFSSSFCTATLFLFLHEWMKVNTDWTNKSFRLVLFCGVIFLSFAISVRLPERIWFTGMSLVMLQFWTLYFYRDVFAFTPIILGTEAFMDMLWLSLIGILMIHFLENTIRMWIMKKKQPHWS